jgi:hypothetical protein
VAAKAVRDAIERQEHRTLDISVQVVDVVGSLTPRHGVVAPAVDELDPTGFEQAELLP